VHEQADFAGYPQRDGPPNASPFVSSPRKLLNPEKNPGEFETVRRVLGHRSAETTSAFYCGMEQAAAFERYDEVVSQYLAEADRDAD
jgi:hypothetical protein